MEPEWAPRTLSTQPGGVLSVAVGGEKLAPAQRDRLLADLRAGRGPARLTLEAVVFRQGDEPNRNFVRFRDDVLQDLGASFAAAPFLRDHEQRDVAARWGTVLGSAFKGGKGAGEIRQTIELVDPTAIMMALDGRLDRFSIGWNNTAAVVCSVCDAPLVRGMFGGYPSCAHLPGDKVVDKDDQVRLVEMVITGAEGVETSAVSVPAVKGTGIEEIRTQLAAARAAQRVRTHLHKEIPMKILASKLGLTETADEATMLSAVEKLLLDGKEKQSLLSVETEAHVATRADRDALAAQLAGVHKAERDKEIAELAAQIERKNGKGEQSKELIETMHEMAELSIERARSFVAKVKPRIPIGQPLLSVGTALPLAGDRAALTAQQKTIAKQFKLTEAQYSAQIEKDREQQGEV